MEYNNIDQSIENDDALVLSHSDSELNDEALIDAADALLDVTQQLTYDGDRSHSNHVSGEEHVLAEEVAWEGKIFSVDRLRVGLPDGREAIRDVVRHRGAVAVVALTNDGCICLVRQYRTALGRVTVEIPAGKLDPGEDPLTCARRELLEETGMEAEQMAYLTTIASSDGFCDELIHIYMATGLTFTQSDPDADEFINVDLVELSELVDTVLDGRIEDAKTVVGALICDAVSHRLAVTSE